MNNQFSVRKIITISSMLCLFAGVTSFSAQAAYPTYMERNLIKICTAIKDNKPFQLHMAVKKSGLTYRALEQGLVCNNMDIHAFAQASKAVNTGKFLARRLKYKQQLTASR
ncbi:DUF3718 domain-containing protein [Salinimonas chungwhensis]|uniref:DUF3718 domain-containing protein n=1 Tax=Salinimonas chungwhensis TaxID=265425 RepID=UPI00035E6235|nr:DUF3718 domain-containing protein [Salinimonas chungwhensis]